jgi:hypothetical protein
LVRWLEVGIVSGGLGSLVDVGARRYVLGRTAWRSWASRFERERDRRCSFVRGETVRTSQAARRYSRRNYQVAGLASATFF